MQNNRFSATVVVEIIPTSLEIPTARLPCGYPTSEADFMPKITKRAVDGLAQPANDKLSTVNPESTPPGKSNKIILDEMQMSESTLTVDFSATS